MSSYTSIQETARIYELYLQIKSTKDFHYMKRKKKVNVISYLQVQLSVFRTSLILRYHRSQNKKFKEECIKIIIAKMQESKKDYMSIAKIFCSLTL